MTDRLSRAWQVDLEIRGDGRTIYGLAAPFNTPADIFEMGQRFTEMIAPGAFTRTIAERGNKVKLLALHDMQSLPIGRATNLVEDTRGLVGEFRVSATAAGDEALTLVRDGALDSFSIGFSLVRDAWQGDQRTLHEVRLHEVSLVPFPAYETALVAGVRSSGPAPTPILSAAQRRLELLRKGRF